MNALKNTIQISERVLNVIDNSFLSKFMIGRKIAGLFKNKLQRTIFLIIWFAKTVVFYWWIL